MPRTSSSSSSSTTTPVAYSVALENANSAHPVLRLSLPASFLDAPKTASHNCRPSILLKLPPGLFVDPHTFPVNLHPQFYDGASQNGNFEHHARRQDTATALPHERDVIRNIRLLGSPGGDGKHDVELEKGTGYSLTSAQRVELQSSESGANNAQLARQRVALLSREYTAALIHLHRVRVPDVAMESESAIDDGLDKAASQVARPESIAPKAQLLDVVLPLHTRYPIPLGSGQGDMLGGIDWQFIRDSLIWPARGSYDTLLLEQPHAFWSCRGDGMLAVDSGIYEPTTPLELLTPLHKHLQIPSPSPMSPRQQQLYRLSPPSRVSREPFRLTVPAGQARLGQATQLATLVTLILAAFFIVRQTSVAVHRSKQVI